MQWDSFFRQDPINAEEALKRHRAKQPPFQRRPQETPKAEPPPDLHRDGLVEWERLQAVKDALATVGRERDNENARERTADLRARVRERWPHLSYDQFMAWAKDFEEGSHLYPAEWGRRLATANNAPSTERMAQDVVNVAVREQKVASANEMLDGLKRDQRLPPDYDALESSGELEAVLHEMNARGMQYDSYEAKLDEALRWSRDRLLAKQMQQGGAANEAEITAALDTLRSVGRDSGTGDATLDRMIAQDFLQKARAQGISNDPEERIRFAASTASGASYEQARNLANQAAVWRARNASRSVTGGPSTPGVAGPATRRPGSSYDADLEADARQAYAEAMGR